MNVKIVDLYQCTDEKRADSNGGYLKCLIPDAYREDNFVRVRPSVLILPGGGYTHVSPREAEPVALAFAAHGYAAFVLEYAVAPAVFPTALREAALAMRYIRAHETEFSIGEHMTAAIGFSAGAHLCGLLGTWFDAPEVADIAPANLLRPDAIGLNYPVAVSWGLTHEGSFDNLCKGDGALRARLSLDRCVRADMPPVFLWHTRNDEAVPCRNSLELALALEKAGVDFAMHVYHRGEHGVSTAKPPAYRAGSVPRISADVPDWLEAEIGFFTENGLKMRDFEVKK